MGSDRSDDRAAEPVTDGPEESHLEPEAPADMAAGEPAEDVEEGPEGPPGSPEPGGARRPFQGLWGPIVLGVLVASVVALVVASLLTDPVGDQGPGPTVPRPTAPTSLPTTPTSTPPTTELSTVFPTPVGIGGMTFQIVELERETPGCLTHTLEDRAAFLSNCDGVPGAYLFHAVVRNESTRLLPFRLSNFILVDREERAHSPRTISGTFLDRSSLPRFVLIEPDGVLSGWLAFDPGTGFVPDRLSYPLQDFLLLITFPGEHHIETSP